MQDSELGGTKLDAFRTVLASLYKVNGFRKVDSPLKGWREEDFIEYQYVRPDVVFIELNPDYSLFD